MQGMNCTQTDLPVKLNLRVLEEYDPESNCYVARCLETGAVAAGRTIDEARQILMDVVRHDALLARRAGGILSLFCKPAGAECELRWQHLAALRGPVTVEVMV